MRDLRYHGRWSWGTVMVIVARLVSVLVPVYARLAAFSVLGVDLDDACG